MPKTSLEQWITLITVVETGSFAKAGNVLHKSQSSVSYAIKNLQETLGAPLLQLVGRKAELTPIGETLLAQAKPLIDAFVQLEAHAKKLKSKQKLSLRFVVDVAFPADILFSALSRFHSLHPNVRIDLAEVLKDQTEHALAQTNIDLYILPLPHHLAHMGNFLLDIDFIAVAHRDHPLHLVQAPITTTALASYPLITIEATPEKLSHKNLNQHISRWRFTTIDAALEAVIHKVGYGWLPVKKVQSLLQEGVLKPLPLTGDCIRKTSLYLVYGPHYSYYDEATKSLADIVTHETQTAQIY